MKVALAKRRSLNFNWQRQFLLSRRERPQFQVLASPAYYMPVIELLGHYLGGKFEIMVKSKFGKLKQSEEFQS